MFFEIGKGFDAKYKSIITALNYFGIIAKPDNVLNIGITTLQPDDIKYAAEKSYKIKLVPTIAGFRKRDCHISITKICKTR